MIVATRVAGHCGLEDGACENLRFVWKLFRFDAGSFISVTASGTGANAGSLTMINGVLTCDDMIGGGN